MNLKVLALAWSTQLLGGPQPTSPTWPGQPLAGVVDFA
jgi:hypothetical protein